MVKIISPCYYTLTRLGWCNHSHHILGDDGHPIFVSRVVAATYFISSFYLFNFNFCMCIVTKLRNMNNYFILHSFILNSSYSFCLQEIAQSVGTIANEVNVISLNLPLPFMQICPQKKSSYSFFNRLNIPQTN
jgi:hypothetical protein